ncbi:hypothetical protein V5N11_020464 [Cardamine amara subsp. amara]|uniref:Uncharacterized protein n=1 Tax=Cardamine amara subsp. amara TaxID=228776 RepID=A0ABD1A6T0_CARAN
MGLHNFIRRHKIEDVDFEEGEKENDGSDGQQNVSDDANDESVRVEEDTEAGNYMKIVRDQIAEQIWYSSRRGCHQR